MGWLNELLSVLLFTNFKVNSYTYDHMSRSQKLLVISIMNLQFDRTTVFFYN